MFFFERTHFKHFIPYSLSTELYKDNFFIINNNIVLYV
jgi:hypothetical protein